MIIKHIFKASLFSAALLLSFNSQAEIPEIEGHLQTTFNWQKHPAFSAAYSGPNSIVTAAESMYTFSGTAFLGIKPWNGTAFFYNAEMVEGVPFSTNLVGLGGFTNGEITRAGGTSPSYYRQRLFLRQTWNNGGGAESRESSQNQLVETVDHNRVVLTIGNFSTLDVIDGNRYAKDPRTQFMNWGNWTYSAYDYAADARGFGWGAIVEWIHDDWALRGGRMTGPQEPNMLPTDMALDKHYGDQIEVEHSHTWAARPGKVRVLVWHNRAKLAAFNDALNWLKANPGTYTSPDALYAVRNTERDKQGIGLNLEQEFNDHFGAYLRLMQTDGRTETHAFTEVDASFSSGLAFNGEAWGRAQDSAGVSYLQNRLSDDRRRFLAAGGISFFLGDTQLNYRPEHIMESYYSLHLYKNSWLTADYQFIQNPAYNADRGPLHVFACRLHAEY
jgi:hypothetical protein